MKFFFCILSISIFLIGISCASGPSESPDGKYGNKAVAKNTAIDFAELGPKRGQYVKQEIVLLGTIDEIDSLHGAWFKLKTDKGGIKCTITDFGLPQSLVGKTAYAQGILEIILASSEKGRPIGGEYTMAADPSGSSYDDELRLRVNAVEVLLEETSE
ncbi:hypothetical protein KKB99_03755 [bacterium]|nr:hypothetical protein [bacterium]MBU1025107.1 hypothetical protein [bacterium]